MNVSSVCASVSLLLAAAGVQAAEGEAVVVSPLAATGKVAFFLVLVLALILLLAWLARQTRMGSWQMQQRQTITMKTLASMNLGIKERLVVVEVDGRRLLLGVTPQQINTLAELEADERQTDPVSANNNDKAASGFAELLKKTLVRNGNL